jgi:hypothetical protein
MEMRRSLSNARQEVDRTIDIQERIMMLGESDESEVVRLTLNAQSEREDLIKMAPQ